MPPKSTSGRLTFFSSVRVGVYTGMSVTSCPRAINSTASPLSRKQLPQYIPAAPAVIDRMRIDRGTGDGRRETTGLVRLAPIGTRARGYRNSTMLPSCG